MYQYTNFDPENCSRAQMKYLADTLDQWLTLLVRTMIIPDEVMKEYGDDIEEGKRRVSKLIKKLRKGDRSVFVDESDYDIFLESDYSAPR